MDLSLRAILFTDLEGSTALAARLGDPESRDLIRTEYEIVCEETIAKYGGHVFKRLGDGILADFGSARQAVESAREIHGRLGAGDSGLRARIAITIGEPVEEAGDFFGTAVNAAQRAASIGHGGETVVSAAGDALRGSIRPRLRSRCHAAEYRLDRLPPQDLRRRDGSYRHRLDLDVAACLISVDLQEHVPDAKGRPLRMGDDNLDPVMSLIIAANGRPLSHAATAWARAKAQGGDTAKSYRRRCWG